MKNRFAYTYEFRPLPEDCKTGGLLRYNNGKWTPDDGEWDVAFASLGDYPYAYGVYMPYYENIMWSWFENGIWDADVRKHPRGNAWHYMLVKGEKEWGESVKHRNGHINVSAIDNAMSYVASKRHCANGSGVEFHINDPYIAKKLVRIRETKKIITFPKIFKCMYCGDIDWKKEENKK